MQFINSIIGSSATKHPNQRTILKLRLKKCFIVNLSLLSIVAHKSLASLLSQSLHHLFLPNYVHTFVSEKANGIYYCLVYIIVFNQKAF